MPTHCSVLSLAYSTIWRQCTDTIQPGVLSARLDNMLLFELSFICQILTRKSGYSNYIASKSDFFFVSLVDCRAVLSLWKRDTCSVCFFKVEFKAVSPHRVQTIDYWHTESRQLLNKTAFQWFFCALCYAALVLSSNWRCLSCLNVFSFSVCVFSGRAFLV